MSFQALGAIAKFKRANTKKKNLLSRPKAPTMSRKVSSNSAKVNFSIQLKNYSERNNKLLQFYID